MGDNDVIHADADGNETEEEGVGITNTEEFVQNNPLVDLLTPAARVRILMTLINLRGGKLNPSGICERAAISHDTWYNHRDELVETYEVIEEAGNMGNSPLYRVDMEDPIVKRLEEVLGIAVERRNRVTEGGESS